MESERGTGYPDIGMANFSRLAWAVLICTPDPSRALTSGDVLALDISHALPVAADVIKPQLARGEVTLYFSPDLAPFHYDSKRGDAKTPQCAIKFSASGLHPDSAERDASNYLVSPSTDAKQSCILDVVASTADHFGATAEKINCVSNPSGILSLDCRTGGTPMTPALLEQLLSGGSLTNVRKGCRPPRPVAALRNGKIPCPEPRSGTPLAPGVTEMFSSFRSSLDAVGTLRGSIQQRLRRNAKDLTVVHDILEYVHENSEQFRDFNRVLHSMTCFPGPPASAAQAEPLDYSHRPETLLVDKIYNELPRLPPPFTVASDTPARPASLPSDTPTDSSDFVSFNYDGKPFDERQRLLSDALQALPPEQLLDYFTKEAPFDQVDTDMLRNQTCVPTAAGPQP